MKYVVLLSFFFALAIQSVSAQQKPGLAGDWKGYIDIQDRQLGIGAHFKKTDDTYSGTIDIPKQGVSGAHLEQINLIEPDSVVWVWNTGPSGIIRFNGVIKNDSTIKGEFHQNGYTFPFQLHREKSQNGQIKPKKLPYKTERLIIKRDSIPIGGTLTLPDGQAPKKVVILVSGSGAQNRDAEVFGFKVFREMADYLTRHGIATFRFDDRGIGESGGDPNVGLDELTEDVQAIYDSLHKRPQLSQASIGLLGHSQGGYIADKLAAKNAHIGFIVLMSGPSFPLDDIILQQTEAIEKAKGTPDSVIQKGLQSQRELFEALQENKLDSLRKAKISELETELENAPGQKKQQIGDLHTYATQTVNQQLAPITLPIFQSMLSYDPVQDVQKIHVPVLALFGEKDLQVLPELNAKRLRTALEKSEADYTIKIMDNANHLYQKTETGLPSEYESLDRKFVDDFLPTIAQWIKQQ